MDKLNLVTAIYCRVANKCDDAIKIQEQRVRNYAEENGYTNIKVYADNGHGGHNYDRPAFKQLQSDIDAGIVGIVLVMNVDRITRNISDLPEWVFKCHKERTGIKFISVMNDTGILDSFQKDFQEVFTKAYKEMHSQKIKNGLKRKKRKAC